MAQNESNNVSEQANLTRVTDGGEVTFQRFEYLPIYLSVIYALSLFGIVGNFLVVYITNFR